MFNRKNHWQNIYQDKSPLDVSWYQSQPSLSLELIHHTSINHDQAVIDVGGGASLLVDYLCNEGYRNLSVLDISSRALTSSKQRMAERARDIEWFEADITEFLPPHPYAVWHDRAVFHFLTDETDRQKYVAVLKQALRPGGQLIMAAFAIGGPEQCSGLKIVQYDAPKLLNELGEDFELLEQREEIHLTPSNRPQQFGYFRFEYRPI